MVTEAAWGGLTLQLFSPLFFLIKISVNWFFLCNFLPIIKLFLLTSMKMNCANLKQGFLSP